MAMRGIATAIPLLLSLVLALGGGTVAAMHGRMALAGAVVICSAHGLTTVLIGADGEPIPIDHPCGDCLACAVVAQLPAPAWPEQPLQSTRLVRPAALPLPQPADHVLPNARDPPVI